MENWFLISVLGLVGLSLCFLEIFLPGIIAGVLGASCLLGSVVLAYAKHGFLPGTETLVVELSLLGYGFWAGVRLFPNTKIGKRMLLQDSNPAPHPSYEGQVSPGDEGTAISPLRPAGVAEFKGHRLDVVSENAFIEAGTHVKIVRLEQYRVVVRPI